MYSAIDDCNHQFKVWNSRIDKTNLWILNYYVKIDKNNYSALISEISNISIKYKYLTTVLCESTVGVYKAVTR